MLHTKFRGNRPTGSGEEDFEVFLPYMGVAAILSCDLDFAIKLEMPLPKESPHKISTSSAKRFQRRRSLKLWTPTDGRTDDGRRTDGRRIMAIL